MLKREYTIITVLVLFASGGSYFLFLKGKEISYKQNYDIGRIDGIKEYAGILDSTFLASPYIFVSKKKESSIPINYIVSNRKSKNQNPVVDSLNIGVLNSLAQFSELDDTMIDTLFHYYEQYKEEILKDYHQDYADFLYSLEGVDLTPSDRQFKMIAPLSNIICRLSGLLSPLGKHKLMTNAVAKGGKVKKATKGNRVKRIGENYVKRQICEVILESSIEFLVLTFLELTTNRFAITEVEINEVKSQLVSKLITEEVKSNFSITRDVESSFLSFFGDETVISQFSTDISIGTDLNKLFKVNLRNEVIGNEEKIKLNIVLANPEALNVHVRMDNILDQSIFNRLSDADINRFYRLAHDKAMNTALQPHHLERAKKTVAMQIKKIYEPLLLKTNRPFEINVEFQQIRSKHQPLKH